MSENFGESFAETLLSVIFPRRCPVCGEIVLPKGQRICPPCVKKLDFVREPRCLKCGRTLADEQARYCHSCETRERSFEKNLALLFYDDCMRRTMAAVKYHHKKEYLAPLGRLLALKFAAELKNFRADCLLPVPLHPERRRSRGFNQAEELAREVAKELGLPLYTDILLRHKKTEAQKSLGPDARIRNLAEAFRADETLLSARGVRRIILVDDIFTTGSTIEASTRVLRAAGAEAVMSVCLCIVPED